MKKASLLPYYPRFIFSCSDGKCFTTADLDELKHIKDADDVDDGFGRDITQFVPGQRVQFSWLAADDGIEVKVYTVEKIEVHQIKYDLDKETKGMNSNDCSMISGKPKKHMMEIYVFLEAEK